MKWLILSDTHGYYDELFTILDKEKDVKDVIFLGDGIEDISKIQRIFTEHNFICVRGNCDIDKSIETTKIISLENYKVLITHGDGFDVKRGVVAIRRAAKEMKVQIVIHGHTHRQYYEFCDDVHIFCPGSVKPDVSSGYCPSYGIMEIKDTKVSMYNCEII